MKDLTQYNITPFESNEAVIAHIKNELKSSPVYHIITANPEIVFEAISNPEYEKIFSKANLVIADGIGVSLPMSWKGYSSVRVPGIDIFEALLVNQELGEHGVYLLGAKQETVVKTAEKLVEQGINVIGYQNGFFTLEDSTLADIAKDIKSKKPSIVAAAMGAPRQDIVIKRLKEQGVEAIFIGVGGAFDVLSGEVKRAPSLMRKIKLEWLYRLLIDLKRIPRYKKIVSYLIWLFRD